jgi:hypothetical protein
MQFTNFIGQGIFSTSTGSDFTSYKDGSGAVVLDVQQTMPAGVAQAGVNFINPSLSAGGVSLTSNAGIPALFDLLNAHLTGGNLSAATKTTIVNFVTNASPNYFPYTYVSGTPTATQLTQMRDRVRAVVHLIITSPEYSIQR